MKILFTGGYTLGSVTPLLAVAEKMSSQQLFWIGTRKGPERKLVKQAGIKFFWIWAPKWRRYFDLRNILAPLLLSYSVIESLCLLLWTRPRVIVTAGGFVGVPLVWAGYLLGIPSLLHSQDVRWSLANRLVAPFVLRITYSLPDIVPHSFRCSATENPLLSNGKWIWTGNPVRSFILNGDKEKGLKICGFDNEKPTILVIGGGTGAQRLNEIVWEALPELTKDYQVVHLTGKGKCQMSNVKCQMTDNYCQFEFVDKEIGDLYAVADLVITRAGMGALTELAALGKCMIIVPIPGTHQEDNARYFERKKAAVVLDQDNFTGDKFVKTVKEFFGRIGTMQEMSERAKELSKPGAAKRVAEEVLGLAKK